MKPLLFFILCVVFSSVKAQKIEGVILSEKDNEPIEGAIFLDEKRFFFNLFRCFRKVFF